MARIYALLILGMAPVGETRHLTCAQYGCPAGWENQNPHNTHFALHTCCKKAPVTTTNDQTTAKPWYQKPQVRNGLIGGAAAAGLAAVAGVGISAIVQANQKTTPVTTTAWVPLTLAPTAPPTTVSLTVVVRPGIKVADEGSSEGLSSNPWLLALLCLLGLCCCLGLIGLCVFMKSKGKRASKVKPRPQRSLEYEHEATPLVHDTPPPAPAMDLPPLEAPMFALAPLAAPATTDAYAFPTTTVPSYMPQASLYAPAAQMSLYAPAAQTSLYAPAAQTSLYAPTAYQQPSVYTPGVL